MKRLSNFGKFIAGRAAIVVVLLTVLLLSLFVILGNKNDDGTITFDGGAPQYSDAQKAALCELKADSDASVAGLTGVNVPQDSTSDCAPTDLPQMGSLTYYKVSMTTPAAFRNSVIGKGFNEGYGLQCVAGFKEFMYSLSGKYIAAAGGGAKGYATQQAQIEPLGFKWHAGTAGLQDGDWAIWTTGQYGHVAMYYQGKWLGQNQYAADPNAGNAFNVASISTGGIAGYYRPNIYVKVTPTPQPTPKPETKPTPEPTPSASVDSYLVRRGDTLGSIALKNGWYSSTNGLYGNSGYTQRLAEQNNIKWRGLIYPNQIIKRVW